MIPTWLFFVMVWILATALEAAYGDRFNAWLLKHKIIKKI